MKKVCILRKILAKIALKRRALRDVITLLLMTSLAKKRETAVKSVTCMYKKCNVCLIEKNMKWPSVSVNHVIIYLIYDIAPGSILIGVAVRL